MTPTTPTTPKTARLVRRRTVAVPFATAAVGNIPPLTGTVEVMTAGEWREYTADFAEKRKAGLAPHVVQAHLYARQIKTWDFYGEADDAEPLPVTPESVLALPADVFDQLADVMTGSVGVVSGNG
jgi:hypothetical protein